MPSGAAALYSCMFLRTLGGLALKGAGFHRPKPLLLLAYLALEGPKDRRYLADLFWMGASNARQSLAMALTQLRQAHPDLVRTGGARVWTEVPSDAQRLLEAATTQDWVQVLTLYRGAFLEGVDVPGGSLELEEWIYGAREFLGDKARTALLHQADREAASGCTAEATSWAERAYRLPGAAELEADDLKRLVPLLRAGSSPLAKQAEEEATLLGIPLPKATAPARQTPPDPAAPITSDVLPAAPLPQPGTSFVGREQELHELTELLEGPECRLLSITGMGGSGKTRLALRLVHSQQERDLFESVAFVFLDALTDPASIPAAITSSLGLSTAGAGDALALIAAHIGERRFLLVLDNFEHLLDGADVLADLVRACPNLKVITTSRERLGLAEERVFALEGLTFPSPAEDALEHAPYSDALELFRHRAQRLERTFRLTSENSGAVQRLCQLVQGLPLGIELAAALTRAIPLEELVHELEENLDVLTSLDRGTPDRHSSLQAVFEHSWRLLPTREREVLCNLSLFQGGFTRRAAAEVAQASIPLLASLVDKSLVHTNAQARYDLHPLVRTYAAQKLTRDVEVERSGQERHAEYFASFVGSREVFDKTPDQRAAFLEIETELANIRAAWRWAARVGREDLLERMRPVLQRCLDTRSRLQELEAFADEALPRVARGSLLWAYLLATKALACLRMGRIREARSELLRSFDAHRELGNEEGMVEVLIWLGHVAGDCHDWVEVEVCFRRALEGSRRIGSEKWIPMCLCAFALMAAPLEGLRILEEVVELDRQNRDPYYLANHLQNLAFYVATVHGDYGRALELTEEAAAVTRADTGDHSDLTWHISCSAEQYLAMGEFDAVEARSREALALLERPVGRRSERHRRDAVTTLALTRYARGDLEGARALVERNLHERTTHLLRLRARLALAEGNVTQAAACLREGLVLAQECLAMVERLNERAKTLLLLAETSTGSPKEAKAFLQEALELACRHHLLPTALEGLVTGAVILPDANAREFVLLAATHPASAFLTRHRAREVFGEVLPEEVSRVPAEEVFTRVAELAARIRVASSSSA